jgi:hypothetical protein
MRACAVSRSCSSLLRSVTSSIRQQDLLCVMARPMDPAHIEQHHPSSNRREHAIHLEILDRRAFLKDGFEQGAQLGYVPLAVAELVELAADRMLRNHCECLAKRAIGKPHREVGLQNQKAFAERLDEIQWIDFAQWTAPARLRGWADARRQQQGLAGRPILKSNCGLPVGCCR